MEKSVAVTTRKPDIAKVMDGTEWSELEQALLDACETGVGAVPEGVVWPDDPSDAAAMVRALRPSDTSQKSRRVRAGLIRYLLLGGCDGQGGARPHPKGVEVIGGWIDGELDFEGCETQLDLKVVYCLFPQQPNFRDAHLGGLFLSGSRCESGLHLHRLVTENDVMLHRGFECTGTVDLRGARVGGLFSCIGGRFDGAGDTALDGDSMTVGTGIFLREGFHATGTVNLIGARIGGQLDCRGGRFDGAGDRALNGGSMTIGADVFLRDGFHATGMVNLIGARIGGQFSCSGGRFDGVGDTALNGDSLTVGSDVLLRDDAASHPCHMTGSLNFIRAHIGGNLQFSGTKIEGRVGLQSSRIDEGLFWQDIQGQVPLFDLTEARIGVLRDDAASWRKVTEYRLSGFRYDRLGNGITIRQRIEWLGRKAEEYIRPAFGEEVEVGKLKLKKPPGWVKGAYKPDFDPQPYTQLAKVLEAQGNRNGAARVLYQREKQLRPAARNRAYAHLDGSAGAGWHSIFLDLRRVWDFLFRWVFGYGHMPARALVTVFVLWLGSVGIYSTAYNAGQMAPNSDVVLTSYEWINAVEDAAACQPVDWKAVGWDITAPINQNCTMPMDIWLHTAQSAPDYETFNPRLYALDLFVPLDALGQEQAWAPSRDRGWLGWLGYAMRMWVQVAGWVITAVGAAVLTGLVGRKD